MTVVICPSLIFFAGNPAILRGLAETKLSAFDHISRASVTASMKTIYKPSNITLGVPRSKLLSRSLTRAPVRNCSHERMAGLCPHEHLHNTSVVTSESYKGVRSGVRYGEVRSSNIILLE